MPAAVIHADLPAQQYIGSRSGGLEEERHTPSHNNADGDADADIGKQRKPSAVLLCEMSDRNGSIDLQNGDGSADEHIHRKLGDHPARAGRQRIFGQIVGHIPDRRRDVAQVGRREHREQKSPAQNGNSNAADLEDQACQELGADMLRGRHGQREHEIPFVAEKALIKPVDNENKHENAHRRIERHEQNHRQHGDNKVCQLALDIAVERDSKRETVDRCKHRQTDPDQRKCADAGAQIVFHQFTEHCIPLHSP